VAPHLLRDEREHIAGRMLSRDEGRHSAQRLLLPQTGAQGALEALILDRELGGVRPCCVDSPVVHGGIVPRTRGARKSLPVRRVPAKTPLCEAGAR
jgi:hypothetical protein